ncbi:YtpI family protein [Bacillus licheniformis]|nr:YtpI family protein [Bacillus licheniformis]
MEDVDYAVFVFYCGFSDSLCVLQSKVCAHQKAVEREYYSAKSSMSLGLFIMFFGANQLI